MTLASFDVLKVTLIFAIPGTPAQGCDVFIYYLGHWRIFFVRGREGFRGFG